MSSHHLDASDSFLDPSDFVVVCTEKLVYAPVVEMHPALKAHDLDVADAVEVHHDPRVVGIVDCSFDPEPSQSSPPMATVAPESASISQPQSVLAPEELVAFAVVNDSMADLALVEVGHKAFVAGVWVSLVVILLPFSLLLSSQSLQFLLWTVVPIAVDSSRRRRYLDTRSSHKLINIWTFVCLLLATQSNCSGTNGFIALAYA